MGLQWPRMGQLDCVLQRRQNEAMYEVYIASACHKMHLSWQLFRRPSQGLEASIKPANGTELWKF